MLSGTVRSLAWEPPRTVEDEKGMRDGADATISVRSSFMAWTDLRHDDRRAGVARRTHGAEQIRAEAQITAGGGALPVGRPHARQGTLVADPLLTLEP
jgi:hypothetical protein